MNNEVDKIKYGNDEIENLWTAVCSNDIEFMKNYYASGGIPNKRYNNNSFIMRALRNGNYNMVELLKQNNETLIAGEIDEYKKLMVVHNYKDELTETSSIGKVQDLLDKAQRHRENLVNTPPIESRLTLEESAADTKALYELIDRIYKS